MRLQYRSSEDLTLTEQNWRVAPAGELLDQHGGMIAGDVRFRMASLTARANGMDRWNHAPAVEDNAGQDCVRRQEEAKREQAEHVRIFGR